MRFVIFSMDGTWIKNVRNVFLKTFTPFRTLRNPEQINEIIEPAIWFVDVDTIKNREVIQKIKDNKNTIKLYLASVNVNNAGIDFPKYNIVSRDISQEFVEENKNFFKDLEEEQKETMFKTKEDAIKGLPPGSSPVKPTPYVDDDLDDDIKSSTNRKTIDKKDAIYEDEKDFDPFEDREDMRPKSVSTNDSIGIQSGAKLELKSESTSFSKPKTKIEPKQEERPSVKRVLYENNQRSDRNLGEQEYISKLNLGSRVELRCPIILGKPMEYISSDLTYEIDEALSKYRIKKLKKAGLDKWGIVEEIKKSQQIEDGLRKTSLKEREAKRLEFLKKFDDSKIDSSKVPKTSSSVIDKGEQLQKDLGVKINESQPIYIDKDKFEDVEKGARLPPKVNNIAPKITSEGMKSREEIMAEMEKVKKSAKERHLTMDTDSESIIELQKRKREEIRQKAEKSVLDSKKSTLPDLPRQRLTERSEMAQLYKDENIRRAESRTELKTQVRPPKEMIPEIKVEEDNGKKKKKGFFGFGKGKK